MSTSETTQWRIIFPDMQNDHGTLFGGILMKWMDEVAYITATRHIKMKMVTVSVENIKFSHPILVGNLIEIKGTMVKKGVMKVFVRIEVYREEKYSDAREKAIEATFIFASVDQNNRPLRIP